MIDRYIYVYYVGVPEGNRSLDTLCMISTVGSRTREWRERLIFCKRNKNIITKKFVGGND